MFSLLTSTKNVHKIAKGRMAVAGTFYISEKSLQVKQNVEALETQVLLSVSKIMNCSVL